MIEDIIKEKKETSSHYRNEIIEPDVFRAFHKLGEILSYKKSNKEDRIIGDISELAKKSLPRFSEHSFAFLFIGTRSFSYYNSKNRDKKDKLNIRNPGVDIYGKMPVPINIFNDNPEFVKDRFDKAIKHEGIFVLDRDSGNIRNNGLIIPIDYEDLYTKFDVNDDIELIEKTGYPKRNPPEIGTKAKAMLYFSIYHHQVSFMRFNNHCYIMQKGRIVYQCKKDDFKDSSKSLPAMS